MIIDKISIEKFRGFKNVEFELGKNITIIAGQNGTQKTTILGLLSQPFTITDKENPLYGEKPLCGGSYKSSFSDKFKLSSKFDKPKSHAWTLFTTDKEDPVYAVESISRDKENIRFWKKGDRSKGSGYLQYPVIYLSLSRLMPLGEDDNLTSSTEVGLDQKEQIFYQTWHNRILIIPDIQISEIDYLSSKQKNTIGVSTDFYDWKTNSSGQDNLGKILLAIISFCRLKTKYKEYKKGLLVIDEIDTTLYPASQLKLLSALRKFSSEYNIQIIFTTHSLTILEEVCRLQNDPKINNQIKVLYLQKVDKEVKVLESITYQVIQDKLNVSLSIGKSAPKVPLFTEDKEAELFLKGLLKKKKQPLEFIQCTLGCSNYIELVRKQIRGFVFPESIICLDGDVVTDSSLMKEIVKHKNLLILPGRHSPERLIAELLFNEPESSVLWERLFIGYNKQLCFRDYTLPEIIVDRKKAKDWFNSQKTYWGQNCSKIINVWIVRNKDTTNTFLEEFDKLISKY